MKGANKSNAADHLDPGICPLMERLNATGEIRTVASCQGHGDRVGRYPYVLLRTTVATAAAIEAALRRAEANGRLKTLWVLEGRFNDVLQLQFKLSAPQYVERAQSQLWCWWNFVVHARRMSKEFEAIAQLVEEAVKETLWEAQVIHRRHGEMEMEGL